MTLSSEWNSLKSDSSPIYSFLSCASLLTFAESKTPGERVVRNSAVSSQTHNTVTRKASQKNAFLFVYAFQRFQRLLSFFTSCRMRSILGRHISYLSRVSCLRVSFPRSSRVFHAAFSSLSPPWASVAVTLVSVFRKFINIAFSVILSLFSEPVACVGRRKCSTPYRILLIFSP